jgi:cell division protein FtsN
MHFPSLARQRGNTLTGIIIGLIIGLVIAVIVALVITKGATPFTDKSGKQGKGAEPTPGQAADPNKPLYGNKDAAREANKEILAKTKPGEDPLGAAIATMGADGKPAAPVAAAPATAAPAAAAPAAATAVTPAAAPDVSFYLQAGAFREMTDAENTRAKLALLGFEANISDKGSDSGVLHRVRLGPYTTNEAANKARAKLLDAGVDTAVVRNQK